MMFRAVSWVILPFVHGSITQKTALNIVVSLRTKPLPIVIFWVVTPCSLAGGCHHIAIDSPLKMEAVRYCYSTRYYST
jgi:hypothetical protein